MGNDLPITRMDGTAVILSAHRGDRVTCPENTMPAFLQAYVAGVDMIETDVRMTRDGALVLIHDRSALRTCGKDINIDEMTLQEVRALDAGSLFDPAFAGTTVPTVEEFAAWISGPPLLINWELKEYPRVVGDARAFEAADRLCALIERYGLCERSMLNSFSARVLEHIAVKYPKRFLIHGQGISGASRSYDIPDMPHEELFDWCCMYGEEKEHSPLEYPNGFAYCLKHGILPCVCIPDEEESYRQAIALGCRMFTSNHIYKADAILRRLGVR